MKETPNDLSVYLKASFNFVEKFKITIIEWKLIWRVHSFALYDDLQSSQRSDLQNARVTTLILLVFSLILSLNPLLYTERKHFSLSNAVARLSIPLAAANSEAVPTVLHIKLRCSAVYEGLNFKLRALPYVRNAERFCLITTSYMTRSLAIFLLLHAWQNDVCFVNFYMWGHFVMFIMIIKSLHLISVYFWTFIWSTLFPN